jgi:hypothetical protein
MSAVAIETRPPDDGEARLSQELRARLLADLEKNAKTKRYYLQKHRELVRKTNELILEALDAGVDEDDITHALGYNSSYKHEVIRNAQNKRYLGKI